MLNALKTKRYKGKCSSNNYDDKRDTKLIKIVSEPRFVIKTKIFSSYNGSPPGTKLFINVGCHPKVPMPKDDSGNDTEYFDPAKIFPQIMNNAWEIPILTSPQPRSGKDKKGKHCWIIDCIINRKPMEWVSLNTNLRMILTQWCFDSVEFQVGGNFLIDRDVVKFPKRLYMGELQEIETNAASLDNDFHEVKNLKQSFDQKDDPTNILEAKRLTQEENELKDLRMPNDTSLLPKESVVKSSSLISEVSLSTLNERKSIGKSSSEMNTKMFFTIDLKMLQPNETNGHYVCLLYVTTNLSKADFLLHYNEHAKSIIISSSRKIVKPVVFPLPTETQGVINSYYLKNEGSLYIFVK